MTRGTARCRRTPTDRRVADEPLEKAGRGPSGPDKDFGMPQSLTPNALPGIAPSNRKSRYCPTSVLRSNPRRSGGVQKHRRPIVHMKDAAIPPPTDDPPAFLHSTDPHTKTAPRVFTRGAVFFTHPLPHRSGGGGRLFRDHAGVMPSAGRLSRGAFWAAPPCRWQEPPSAGRRTGPRGRRRRSGGRAPRCPW